MASRYEVEVTVNSARDLNNVNWRYGDLRPYVVLWVDPASKCSTKVCVKGGVNPVWDEKLRIPIPLPYGRRIEDSTLFIDIVHAKSSNREEEMNPLVGSARLPLREVLDVVSIGGNYAPSLQLRRPSGHPQGQLQVKVAVKEPSRYYDLYVPPYRPAASAYCPAPPPPMQYGMYYQSYVGAAPPVVYPYGAPPPVYGAPPPVYGSPSSGNHMIILQYGLALLKLASDALNLVSDATGGYGDF